jgi:membrane protease YdiL (CAAX protease family)
VKTATAAAEAHASWLRRFFVREDAAYDQYEADYQAKTVSEKVIYLFLYLWPGLLAFVCINIEAVFRAQMAFIGLSARYLQYVWVLLITFGWHMSVPFLVLRLNDKLSFRETLRFLGLNRIYLRGLLLVLPVYFLLFVLISLPYIRFVAPVIENWTKTVSFFRIPSYSIFQDTPENMYSFPPVALVVLGIGNFLGEELYFRGYLMKKSAFLGKMNFDSLCSLPSVAGSADVATDRTGVGVWSVDGSPQGPLCFDCVSFLGEHVVGFRNWLEGDRDGGKAG